MNENYKDDMEIKIMEAFNSMKSDQEIGMPDIEKELSILLAKKSKQSKKLWYKIAASVAIVVTVCSIAIAAITNHKMMSHDDDQVTINENTLIKETKDVGTLPIDTTMNKTHLIAFDNDELYEIMDSISNIYKVEVVYCNDEVKHLHLHFKFDTNDKLNDVIQSLNMFEKININQKNGKLEVE